MTRALVLAALMLALPSPLWAAGWGGIEPGQTTLEDVRGRYGRPSRETRAKVQGYDTVQWIYEGSQAPPGLTRILVDFGILIDKDYKPSVVRILRLEPKPLIFGRNTVIDGWGVPDGVSKVNEQETFFYKAGLLVTFDKEGQTAVVMNFTVPQPLAATSKPTTPSAPASGSAPRPAPAQPRR